jgi:type IV secretion system protein TrbL
MPGPCDVPGVNLVCDAAGDAASSVAASAFTAMAESAGTWAGEMVVHAMTWWVQTPSVDPNTDAVRTAQQWTLPIVGFMLVGSVLWQCARLILSRKKEPLLNIGLGLVRYTVIVTLGLVVLAGAIQAGDALASAMMNDAAETFANRMKGLMTREIIQNPFGLLILGLLLGLIALVQWIIGFLRQAGILILAAMIPLAASGSLNDSTKTWWPKLATASLALVAYKPMAAFIYMIGFTFMGEGEDLATVMVGVMVLFLALFALPALLKFFSWAETRVSGGGGGGGAAFAGAAGAVAMAASGGGGGSSSAPAMASAMQATGPGSQGAGAGAFGAIPGAPTGATGSGGPGSPGGAPGSGPAGGTTASSPGHGSATGAATSGAVGESGAQSGGPRGSGGQDAPSPAPSGAPAASATGSPEAAAAAPAASGAGAAAAAGPAGAAVTAGQQGYQATQAAANEMSSSQDDEGGQR